MTTTAQQSNTTTTTAQDITNGIWHVCLVSKEPLGGRWDELLGVDETNPALHQPYGFLSRKGVEKVKAELQTLGFDSVWTESTQYRSLPISWLVKAAKEYKFYIDNNLQPVEVTVEDLTSGKVDLCNGYYHDCHPITSWKFEDGNSWGVEVMVDGKEVSLSLPCVLFHA